MPSGNLPEVSESVGWPLGAAGVAPVGGALSGGLLYSGCVMVLFRFVVMVLGGALGARFSRATARKGLWREPKILLAAPHLGAG